MKFPFRPKPAAVDRCEPALMFGYVVGLILGTLFTLIGFYIGGLWR